MFEKGYYIELAVFEGDKIGKIIELPFRSFVHQHTVMMQALFTDTAQAGVISTSGASFSLNPVLVSAGTNYLRLDAGTGIPVYGIVVGSGSNPATINDTKLQAQIGHGTGVGQLSYAATTFTAPSSSSTTASFQVRRQFKNDSGIAIPISECAIYYFGGGTVTTRVCGSHDVFSSPFTLSSGSTVEVRYTMGITL